MRQNLMDRKHWQDFRIGKENDRRRKLTDEEKADIKKEYDAGGIGTRPLATRYGVSRRLIMFIVHPERLKEYQARQKEEKHWAKYYDKDKRREYQRNFRKHIRELL
jgi:ribosomal protein S9